MDTKNDAHDCQSFSFRACSGAWVAAAVLLLACSDGTEDPSGPGDENVGMNTGGASSGGASTGGVPSSGGLTSTGGVPGSGGMSATGGTLGTGGDLAGTGGEGLGTGGDETGTGGEAAVDLTTYAADLDGVFLDRKCAAGVSLPQPTGAVCDHLDGVQHVEEEVTLGGDLGTTYSVTLRVRGIWEPTNIDGGEQPDGNIPYMIGGDVAAGSGSDSDAINYQQFFIVVSSPSQTYWLNEHDYVAHDIHKEDYEITIPIDGGATVTVVANDGNAREIANFNEEIFEDLPPYDQMPTVGQFLHLAVLGVEVAP